MRFKPVSNGKWNEIELYKHAIYSIPETTDIIITSTTSTFRLCKITTRSLQGLPCYQLWHHVSLTLIKKVEDYECLARKTTTFKIAVESPLAK